MSTGIAGVTSGLHRAVGLIVKEALSRGIGAAMPTNVHYAEQHGISAGTMQRALAVLADRGALEVVSRGHMGRVIRSLDVAQCWQAAGLDPVRLILPPSGPPEADVLAELLAEGLTASGIPHTVHHLPGGTSRLAAVQAGGHDLAVLSLGTWLSAIAGGPSDGAPVLLRKFPAGTYYAPGRLVVVRRADDHRSTGLKVAIDPDSPDHVALTEAALPSTDGHEYISAPFPEVPRGVLRGDVDAGVWHVARSVVPYMAEPSDETTSLAGLRLDPFTGAQAIEQARLLSPAALVGSAGRPELRLVINQLPLDGLVDAQRRELATVED